MINFEQTQNKAFAHLIENCVEYMKSNGSTDKEIKSLVDNAILGMINTIQDYKRFPNHVYNIVAESSKKRKICNERQVGMMCELLDRIEDAIRGKIYELLNNKSIISNDEFQNENCNESTNQDILDILTQMQIQGDLDIKITDLDN